MSNGAHKIEFDAINVWYDLPAEEGQIIVTCDSALLVIRKGEYTLILRHGEFVRARITGAAALAKYEQLHKVGRYVDILKDAKQ